jgi:hypothetical protein
MLSVSKEQSFVFISNLVLLLVIFHNKLIFYDELYHHAQPASCRTTPSRLSATLSQCIRSYLPYLDIMNRCFETVAQFRYLGTMITNQNLIQEESKRR